MAHHMADSARFLAFSAETVTRSSGWRDWGIHRWFRGSTNQKTRLKHGSWGKTPRLRDFFGTKMADPQSNDGENQRPRLPGQPRVTWSSSFNFKDLSRSRIFLDLGCRVNKKSRNSHGNIMGISWEYSYNVLGNPNGKLQQRPVSPIGGTRHI